MRSATLFILLLLIGLTPFAQQPKREFRAMWIATVNNIDWPSKAGASVDVQKKELTKMLDLLEEMNFNAVIFQVRPAADAFYQSETEPWSAYLTGTQGKAPNDNFDPLAFVTEECHRRGMELHAWMNPFRVQQNPNDVLSEKNVGKRHPEWTVTYGGRLYLDPGIPSVRDYINNVVSEVVQKYDIDAIHFDDYFYPYPIANEAFPDTSSFKLYRGSYTDSLRDDWRRNNVDQIIESLNKTIKAIKPTVKFGVSPFGVWRNLDEDPTGSATNGATTNYNHLYADVKKWQQNGWVDYLIPQIYWEIGHPIADYVTLANWWDDNAYSRHMYVGHALYKLVEGTSAAWKSEEEIPEQVMITRKLEHIEGSAFFRMKYLEKNPAKVSDHLKKEIYPNKALLPTMSWLDNQAPTAPTKIVAPGLFCKKKVVIKYDKDKTPSTDLLGYLIYSSEKKKTLNTNDPTQILQFTTNNEIKISDLKLPKKKRSYICITAIDRQNNESTPVGKLKIRKR